MARHFHPFKMPFFGYFEKQKYFAKNQSVSSVSTYK